MQEYKELSGILHGHIGAKARGGQVPLVPGLFGPKALVTRGGVTGLKWSVDTVRFVFVCELGLEASLWNGLQHMYGVSSDV